MIYTTNKEENQIIVKDIDKSRNKIYEMDSSSDFVIQSSNRRADLNDAIKLILNVNEEFN